MPRDDSVDFALSSTPLPSLSPPPPLQLCVRRARFSLRCLFVRVSPRLGVRMHVYVYVSPYTERLPVTANLGAEESGGSLCAHLRLETRILTRPHVL